MSDVMRIVLETRKLNSIFRELLSSEVVSPFQRDIVLLLIFDEQQCTRFRFRVYNKKHKISCY